MAAELVGLSQRDGGGRGHGLYATGEGPVAVGVQTGDEAGALAGPDGVGELGPAAVAEIEVPDEWAQVTGTAPAQKGAGHGAAAAPGTVPLEQADGHHGIGANPGGAPGYVDPGGQCVEVERAVAERLEQPDLDGRDEVPGGHERNTQPEDRLGGHPRRLCGFRQASPPSDHFGGP